MQPSSFPSSVKISWKAKMSSLAAATFLGVQLLRPSKFSFSRSFSCHAFTDMGSHTISAPRAASILGENSAGARLTPRVSPVPLSLGRWGCLTCSSLLWTPYCYSSLARYMHAKHAGPGVEATPHLAEPCQPSRASPLPEHFPKAKAWFCTL